MLTLLKKLSGYLGDGGLLSGHPELLELNVERDFADLEEAMGREEWPFVRQDVEVSHAQPLSTSFVAHKDGRFAGFFTTHNFGCIGYLDMMIIHPEFRRAGVARPLYFKTINAMRRKGLRGQVVHTTNDSARLIRLLGFRPGDSFTLLVRDPRPVDADAENVVALGVADESAIVNLDAELFGQRRDPWIGAMLRQGEAHFYGVRKDSRLVAMLALRPRRDSALCLDTVMARDESLLPPLMNHVLAQHGASRVLQCFARTDGPWHRLLTQAGFSVPEFFVAIGPLVEWRRGPVPAVGLSKDIHSLVWL